MNKEETQVAEDIKATVRGEKKPAELAKPATGRFLLRRVLIPIGAGILTGLAFHMLQSWEEEHDDPVAEDDDLPEEAVEATAKAVWWLPIIRLGSTLLKTYVDRKVREAQEAE